MKWLLEKFFEAAVITEDKELTFEAWVGPREAQKLIKAGEKMFREKAKSQPLRPVREGANLPGRSGQEGIAWPFAK